MSSHRGQGRVLLAHAEFRGGLAVTRSLDRAGYEVHALCAKERNIVSLSRAVTTSTVGPNPVEEPEAFVDQVAHICTQRDIDLVIPVTDAALHALTKRRESLESLTRLAMASPEAVARALDKESNLQLADELGFEFPAQRRLSDGVDALCADPGFPMMVKNPAPERIDVEALPGFRQRLVSNRRALERLIGQLGAAADAMLYQRYVHGAAYNVCCFAAGGDVLAVHAYESRRRGAHTGIFRVTIPLDVGVERQVRALLGRLGWDGVAHVGFLRDGDRYWYMETNARFWASVQGSISAGYDFPRWTADYFVHSRRPKDVGPIALGSGCRDHREDLQALVTYLRGGRPPSTKGPPPGKPRAIADYLAGFRPAIHSDVWRWEDPRPALHDHADMLRRYWRKLRSR